MGLTGRAKILQVHPTRRCNLRCLHCYSSSAPGERGMLDAALLAGVFADARDEGYNVISFSGGEPLLYRPLAELLAAAREHGLGTAVTTNGMLLTPRRVAELAGVLDLLAISLDGVPASHNRIRAHPRAFEVMSSRLPALRESGIPFGFIFTLTQHNLAELEWVARFALEAGARLLQIHPLEAVGRAATGMASERPDDVEASFAYLEAARIQKTVGERMKVQVDVSHRRSLRDDPERVYAGTGAGDRHAPLAELISPLIIEADGTVVPLEHGFSRAYALGNLGDASLARLARRWRRGSLERFRALCREVLEDSAPVDGGDVRPFFNWYEEIRVASRRAEPAAVRVG